MEYGILFIMTGNMEYGTWNLEQNPLSSSLLRFLFKIFVSGLYRGIPTSMLTVENVTERQCGRLRFRLSCLQSKNLRFVDEYWDINQTRTVFDWCPSFMSQEVWFEQGRKKLRKANSWHFRRRCDCQHSCLCVGGYGFVALFGVCLRWWWGGGDVV